MSIQKNFQATYIEDLTNHYVYNCASRIRKITYTKTTIIFYTEQPHGEKQLLIKKKTITFVKTSPDVGKLQIQTSLYYSKH